MALKARFISFYDRLRSTLWFLPAIMAAGSVVVAYSSVALDEAVTDDWLQRQAWAYTGGADGASGVLSTIAGSMITVAGVVFSLTLVALTLASSQFGPRMLRNFMRDRTNQVVLGTFVATFLYCLMVLRTIRRADENGFVPHLSVTLGVVFAFISLLVLIYFIHHVSVSIHADEIVARVADELIDGIDRLFPEELGDAAEADESGASFVQEIEALPTTGIESIADGYVQLVDPAALLSLAVKKELVLRIERRPGHYVVAGQTIATVHTKTAVDDDVRAAVRSCFVLGRQRTPVQDIEFSVLQLVEVAVRALSPGINDPFTAITCIDRLASALARLVQRRFPLPYRVDEEGKLRVIAPAASFEATLNAAFNQIRQNARGNVAVTIRLLEAIELVSSQATRDRDRMALKRHAEMTLRSAQESFAEKLDRESAEERYADVKQSIER